MALTEEDLQTLPDGGIDPINPGKYETLLADLQGNILKGHGRDNSVHLFIKFNPDKQADAKKWIQGFASKYVTSAVLQTDEAVQYRKRLVKESILVKFWSSQKWLPKYLRQSIISSLQAKKAFQPQIDREQQIQGSVFANFFLSVSGYEYLEVLPFEIPGNQSFRYGMKNESVKNYLGDPPVEDWDAGLQEKEIHALVLLADDDVDNLNQEVDRLSPGLEEIGEIVHRENGFLLKRGDQVIEHFGFADGVSQPLFLKGDIDKALASDGNFDKWDPTAPLSLVLAKDPKGKTEDSYGSYLVYRKLEQDVAGFWGDRQKLAQSVVDGDYDLAGALIVGRFPDGTPVVDSSTPSGATGTNNFNYDADPLGENGEPKAPFSLTPKPSKCPFHAHIRKSNPRGDTGRVESSPDYQQSLDIERKHRIARRGISYGQNNTTVRPDSDSGLLFLCFQADIDNQFNFIQGGWANKNDFVAVNVGLDPVIGQPTGSTGNVKWPVTWGDPSTEEKEYDFTHWVHMKGGEYFFAPSLSYLRTIGEETLPLNLDTSLSFDGETGYVKIDYDSVFDLTNNFTIEAWIAPGQLSGIQRIFVKPNAYGLGLNGKGIRFSTYNRQDYDTPEVEGFSDGGWHHLAVVLDANNDASFYVDGEFLVTIPGSAPANQNQSACQIGAGKQNGTDIIEYWKGNLADIRLWNSARTPAEIQGNMSLRLTGYEEGLVGYWPLEQGKGNVVQDNTQSAKNGVVNAGASWDVR